MSVLEDLTSRDPARIWAAACVVRGLTDPELLATLVTHLPEIRANTRGINLGGGLIQKSYHLDFAFTKLEYIRDQKGCLCGLYPLDMFFEPAAEEKSGHVTLLSTQSYTTDCQCTRCGARYQVEEQDYHYTFWEWRRK